MRGALYTRDARSGLLRRVRTCVRARETLRRGYDRIIVYERFARAVGRPRDLRLRPRRRRHTRALARGGSSPSRRLKARTTALVRRETSGPATTTAVSVWSPSEKAARAIRSSKNGRHHTFTMLLYAHIGIILLFVIFQAVPETIRSGNAGTATANGSARTSSATATE